MYTRSQIEENLAYAQSREKFNKSWRVDVAYWQNELDNLPTLPAAKACKVCGRLSLPGTDFCSDHIAEFVKFQESELADCRKQLALAMKVLQDIERNAPKAEPKDYAPGVLNQAWQFWVAGEIVRETLAKLGGEK